MAEKILFTPLKKAEKDVSFKEKEDTKIHLTPPSQQVDFKPSFSFDENRDQFKDLSLFNKIISLIDRPGRALRSTLNQIQKENKELLKNIPEGDYISKSKILSRKRLNIKSKLEAAWRGFSGKERITADKLWKNTGIDAPTLVDFATEIATDPLMYGGYSTITKGIGKAVKATGKGLQKIPFVTKATERAKILAHPAIDEFKKLFINKSGLNKLNELIDKYLSKRQYIIGKEINFAVKTRNVIQNIAKQTGKSIDDVEKQIVNLIEQPHITPPGITHASKTLANILKDRYTNFLTAELKAGVPITALSKNARNILYFPRIATKDAIKYLKQAKIGNAKVWNIKLANALRRKTGDFTLQEFNDFVAFHGLKSLGGKSIEQFFLQNPAYATAARGIKSAKAITSAEFLDETGKIFGLKKAPSWWKELPESVTKLNPSLKGLKFDPEVAGEVLRTTEKYLDRRHWGLFIQAFDSVQNLWKKWTLAPFPKYHLRNMVGNLWNNYLAGVSLKSYPQAQALQLYKKYKLRPNSKKFKAALYALQKLGISSKQADDIILKAEKLGVLGRGWYAADIEATLKERIKKGGIIKFGMGVGTTIENNARLAHFIDKLFKGQDAVKSALSVKKFLFDYGNLTAFEKQIMKRFFPFWTWSRKNIPLQLEMLFKQPQKYAPIMHLLKSREPKDLLRLKYAMPWLYERLPVELHRTAETVTYIPLEGLIPAGDLAKLPRPQEIFAELLSPYLRAPIELMMNKSFYFESEIKRYDKATQELIKLDLPSRVKYAMVTAFPQARLLNEINKLIKKKVRKQKLTPGESVFHHTLSTVYKMNLKDLRDRSLQAIRRKIKDVGYGVFWAKRNQRQKEFERCKQTRQGLIKEYKKLKKE